MKPANAKGPYVASVTLSDGATYIIKGQAAYTLSVLIAHGRRGFNPRDRKLKRWAQYVKVLRDIYGIEIEMVRVNHEPPSTGRHGIYVLIEILEFQWIGKTRGAPVSYKGAPRSEKPTLKAFTKEHNKARGASRSLPDKSKP